MSNRPKYTRPVRTPITAKLAQLEPQVQRSTTYSAAKSAPCFATFRELLLPIGNVVSDHSGVSPCGQGCWHAEILEAG
jgi:hypothetical protein